MKNIFSKLLLFLVPLVLLFGFCNYLFNRVISKKKYYSVGADKKILIVGNSQSEEGMNDSVISHSINLSQSADSYFYNYYKIKKIVTENPNINTVILLYTNNFFFKEMDNWIYDERHIGYKYPKYAHLISGADKCFLFSKNPGSFLIACRDAFRTNAQFMVKKPTKIYKNLEWGRFFSTNGFFDSISPIPIDPKFYADSSLPKTDLKYLVKIADFCKINNKKLILVRMPMPKLFPRINEEELTDFYSSNLSSVAYWDYLSSFNENDKFLNTQHLNTTGANEFSEEINRRLKKEIPELNL